MSVTAFGSLFLPLTLFIVLFKRQWLLGLMCVAAVLQSPSVIDLRWQATAFGITPFLAVAGLVVVSGINDRHPRLLAWRDPAPEARLQWLWLGFAAVAILGALVLPWLMHGMPVMDPLQKAGTHSKPVALGWSPSNLAQVVNLAVIMGVLLRIVQWRDHPALRRRFLWGVVLAGAVSVAIGMQQRLAWNELVPMWDRLWASNPTYSQNFMTWAGPIPRVSWPLVEPSYASAWFAALFGGFLAMFLTDTHRHKALFGAMVALFALSNTLGATGLLAVLVCLVLGTLAVLITALRNPAARGGLLYRVALGALATACVLLGVYLTLRHYALVDLFRAASENILHGRSQTVLGDIRPHADRHALGLFVETWGLGVGLGSNRASSFVATLASTTGALGTLLFLAAFFWQCRLLAVRAQRTGGAATIFFLGSGIAAFVAVAIAIPDPNWPVLWILLLGGFACVVSRGDVGSPTRGAAQPGRRSEPDDDPV